MKPFSKLEAISGKPVVTRDGRKVTQLHEFEVPSPFRIVGHVEGMSVVATWTEYGSYYTNLVASNMDIGMASTKREGWIAYGPYENYEKAPAFATHVWASEEKAIEMYKAANRNSTPYGTIKVTWEE